MEEIAIKNKTIAELTERTLKNESKLRHCIISPKPSAGVPKKPLQSSPGVPTKTSFTLTEAKWQRILQETSKELAIYKASIV